MSSPILDKLRGERDQVRTAAIAIAEGENFDPDDENYTELETRAVALDKRIDKLATLLNEQAAADALDGRMAKSARAIEEQAQQRASQQGGHTRQTWGKAFTETDLFTEYQTRGRGQSARYIIDTDELQTRDLPTGLQDLIDAGLTYGKTTVDVTPPATPTPLLNNISTITVSSNAIEYVAWQVIAGGADVVPEKGKKPSIEYGPTVTSTTLDNIAVYTELTRQLLEDATAVRGYVDVDLRRQILLKEESEAAAVLAGADLQTATGDSMLAAIRVAMANVQAAGYYPNAVLLNPSDYADLDLSVMDATVNGPVVGQRFWGLTPIPSAAQPVGTSIVGDFRTAVSHYIRSQVSLYVTDSHGENFLSNVFTLLAERRAKTAIVRADALSEATAGAGS